MKTKINAEDKFGMSHGKVQDGSTAFWLNSRTNLEGCRMFFFSCTTMTSCFSDADKTANKLMFTFEFLYL